MYVWKMAHTYAAIYFHCVFSTNARTNSIPDDLQQKLWAYLIGIAKNLDIVPVAVGGTSNHAHILIGLKPTTTVSEAIQKLKANSSRWMGEHGINFEWQRGYAAFTVSPSSVASGKTYGLNQERHHRIGPFEEELLGLLRRAKIAHNEDGVFAA